MLYPLLHRLHRLGFVTRDVLHRFLARHGTRHRDVIHAPAGAQVRVEFLERSATGILREAIAQELRPAVPR
jgi:hypothetical protein